LNKNKVFHLEVNSSCNKTIFFIRSLQQTELLTVLIIIACWRYIKQSSRVLTYHVLCADI